MRITKDDVLKYAKSISGFTFLKGNVLTSYQIPLIDELINEGKAYVLYEDSQKVVVRSTQPISKKYRNKKKFIDKKV